MGLTFSGNDLVEVAVQMERNGLQFYSKAADSVKDDRAKELLFKLSRDEIQHLEFFQRLLSTVGQVDIHESYAGEYEKYLQAHVDEQIFTEVRMKQLMAQTTLSERDALQFGIDAEKDAILYYTEMLRFVPSAEHRTIQRIIDEEKTHFSQLTGLLKTVRS